MAPKKGKKKPLTPEELELVEECWYKYDVQSREYMDATEFKALWLAIKGAELFDEDESKAMFEKWDPDKEKKAKYGVYMKEMEEEIKVIGDPVLREETLARIAEGPNPATSDYLEKHELSPEEAVAIGALDGLKCLLKWEDLEELKGIKNPPPGVAEVCYGAMCLLSNPGDEVAWKECQQWLKDPEMQFFKMFSFGKRVNMNQVDEQRVTRCRKYILQQRDWFDNSVISEVDKTAGLIAMWTLIAVRYHDAVDAYKTLPISAPVAAGAAPEEEVSPEEDGAEPAPSPKLFATNMPYLTALPKAEEAYLAGRLVILVDANGLLIQSFATSNAIRLEAKDSSQLRKKHLRESLIECLEMGRVLIVDLVDLVTSEQCNVIEAFDNISPGLYDAVISGKVRDPTYFQNFKGKLGVEPAPSGFAFYILQKVLQLPDWASASNSTAIRVD